MFTRETKNWIRAYELAKTSCTHTDHLCCYIDNACIHVLACKYLNALVTYLYTYKRWYRIDSAKKSECERLEYINMNINTNTSARSGSERIRYNWWEATLEYIYNMWIVNWFRLPLSRSFSALSCCVWCRLCVLLSLLSVCCHIYIYIVCILCMLDIIWIARVKSNQTRRKSAR